MGCGKREDEADRFEEVEGEGKGADLAPMGEV